MNKLGFAIKLASQGVGNAIECNKGQWTSKVVDIREYLKFFDGLQDTDNIVTFMSFDEGGCFLTQLRTISGRMGDFLSGWIYIPNTIEATGDDIMNTYNFVRNILSQSNLNDCIGDIEAFFSKEYPKKEFIAQYLPSSGEEFGVRFIDMYYSMKEILDVDRYQPYYSKFKAIFLLDKNCEVKIANEQVARFKDLTKKIIEKYCIFKAPSPEEVRLLGKGTKIVFKTKQEFISPKLTKKGDTIQLYALRDGFEPFDLPEVIVQEDVQTYSVDPKAVKWRKRISRSMFIVTNKNNEVIEGGVQIFINGKNISNQEALIYEEDCYNVNVKITAPGYENFEKKLNLLQNNQTIVMKRKVKSYKNKIVLVNGKLADMTLESKYLPSENISPLKGYDYEDDYDTPKTLKMSQWFVWKQRLWGFLAALAAVMIIIAYHAFDVWNDTHRFRFGLPPWEEIPVEQPDTIEVRTENNDSTSIRAVKEDSDDNSLSEAIKYLDENDVWSKSEMEKYYELKGLFDDMNAFDFSKILNYWRQKLNTSQGFSKVCISAEKTYNNKWNPKQDIHNPTYNKPGDERINLTNYINWLDQDQTKHSSGNEGPNSNVRPVERRNVDFVDTSSYTHGISPFNVEKVQ